MPHTDPDSPQERASDATDLQGSDHPEGEPGDEILGSLTPRDAGRSDVSVALCTHNGAEYIEIQLRSILDQVPPPAEVVVSDDGSHDSTVEIVRRVAAEANPSRVPVRVLQNPRPLGVTANFAQAIAATGGQLIALSDQDDRWHPGKLAAMVGQFTEREDLDYLFTDARIVNHDGSPRGYGLFAALEITDADLAALRGDAFALLLRRNLATGATVMIRRRLFERAEPLPAEWVHDEWLAIIAAATGAVDALADELIDYRQHGSNQIGVIKAGLGHKIRRVLTPRGDRNRNLAVRSRILADRLAGLPGIGAGTVSAARQKARFEAFRARLPRNRVLRVVPVLRAHRAGLYRRFASQGSADVIRDLLQPA